MDTALQAIVRAAAGTGAPTNPSSRYYGYAVEFFTRPDGTQAAYLKRRIIPQADIYSSVQSYVVVDGDRLDNLATKFLGDPLLFWIIADANTESDPDELTSAAQVGRAIQIPLPSGIPSGARNG
ncbi:MAG: LysM domain-containing protein [Alloacidobacterium sp.]|jgi:nucleoid-associated protein YgaU